MFHVFGRSVRKMATITKSTTVAIANEKLVSPVPLANELANPAEKTATGVKEFSMTTLWTSTLNGSRN